MSYDDFKNDKRSIYAVIKALEIIGEAVKKIPKSLKNFILKYHGKMSLK